MSTVTVIHHRDVDSYTGLSIFVAVAADEDAARQWIQDEVDGRHTSGNQYMKGQSADWWIQYGTFSLTSIEVHGVKE